MHEEFVTYEKGNEETNFERYVTYSGMKWKNVKLSDIDLWEHQLNIKKRKD